MMMEVSTGTVLALEGWPAGLVEWNSGNHLHASITVQKIPKDQNVWNNSGHFMSV